MRQQRNTYFDNGKFLLIFFVVFGHIIRSFIEENDTLFAVYKMIYSFHMPAFILISGHFSKGYFEKDYLLKLMKKLLLPYFIFQCIYSIYYYFLLDETTLTFDILDPQWSLWFLISLFCWHVMLPLFTKMNKSISIFLAIAIGILIGYVDIIDNYLSLSRTFVFFPFFLIGYYMRKEDFYVLKAKSISIASIVMVFTVFIFFYLYPTIDYEWLLGSKPYSQMEDMVLYAWLQRLFIYGLSFIMVLCFWSLVPKHQYFFTRIGKYTLYVYLLHGFIIKYFREMALDHWFSDHHLFWLLAVLSFFITLLLSSKMIRLLVQPFIEIKWEYLKSYFKQVNHKLFS